MKLAKEIRFDQVQSLSVHPAYDATKINIGKLMEQNTKGDRPWIGPKEVLVSRTSENVSTGFSQFPFMLKYNDNEYWIISGQQGVTATVQRFMLWRYLQSEHELIYQGHISTNGPGGTITMRGVRPHYQKYTTGTAAVSGTAVTGTGTTWSSDQQCVGSRIGFGSTDPAQITTWYEISAVGSNTSITLTESAGTISNGAYVIEDLKIYYLSLNATATNGGLFALKGLRPEIFQTYLASASPTLVMATTTDNQRAVYWLADASTVTNTSPVAMAIDEFASWTEQRIYCLDPSGSTAPVFFSYNARAPLTGLGSGKSTAAFQFKTAAHPAITGSTGTTSIARLVTAQHGPGKGEKSYYFLTASAWYRVALNSNYLFSGATNWITDSCREVPPGGVNTYVLQAAMTNLDYDNLIDRFFISQSTNNTRTYITRYTTNQDQFDHVFVGDDRQLDGINADSAGISHINTFSNVQSTTLDGITFFTRNSTLAVQAQQYIYPTGAHWRYAAQTGNALITPKISIGDAVKLYSVYISNAEILGSSTTALPTDGHRVFFRIDGIDDNSGPWFPVGYEGDLSGVISDFIQFKIEFRVIGQFGIGSRLYGLSLLYESEDPLPPVYMWNFGDSVINTGIFGFAQVALWNTAIPVHTIEIRRSDSGALVLEQASSGSALGVFENWNGSSWVAGLGSDTVNKRMRFRPTASLPAGVSLYAKILV